MTQSNNQLQKWLDGQISLGAAANWDKNEIRIISEIAYVLAQQGRIKEAIILFEGLLAVAPATAYFQAALGALFLRLKDFAKAIEYLDSVLENEPTNVASLVNRGEAHLLDGDLISAHKDFEKAIKIAERLAPKQKDLNDEITLAVKRAKALLEVHQD